MSKKALILSLILLLSFSGLASAGVLDDTFGGFFNQFLDSILSFFSYLLNSILYWFWQLITACAYPVISFFQLIWWLGESVYNTVNGWLGGLIPVDWVALLLAGLIIRIAKMAYSYAKDVEILGFKI